MEISFRSGFRFRLYPKTRSFTSSHAADGPRYAVDDEPNETGGRKDRDHGHNQQDQREPVHHRVDHRDGKVDCQGEPPDHHARQVGLHELGEWDKIVIVNLMPTKIATETQLARVLANSPLPTQIGRASCRERV